MLKNRRTFLQTVGLGVLGLPVLGDSFYQNAFGNVAVPKATQSPLKKFGKAKSVIQIWMWGGPSHLDTFDPKPDAGREYCGEWNKPLATNISGIEISQSLPNLAQCADLYSIIRGMTHGSFHHEIASYWMQTGREPGGGLVYPCVGALIAKLKGYDAGYDSPIPPYVVLTTAQGRFSECGFLGQKYKPFVTGGDPSKTPFLVSGYVVEGITPERRQTRRKLLNELDLFGRLAEEDELLGKIDAARNNAYQLIEGDAVKTFDLSTEPEKIRDAYGRNWFGQACLMARRLVQKEAPYITINYRGWDTHKRHFETLTRRQSEWDMGLSTLLKELADLGLLETTLLWWSGEFGRTPKIGWDSPWFGGRGHYGTCFNAVVAGGGFQGGRVVGETDKTGEKIVSRPVFPQDLLGSIYQQLGIDPDAPMPNEKGINVVNMPPASEHGRLTELVH
ncbi:MAG: DUF1501 domain-containing protein [Planctomycetaceae bacterium]|jgi:hypothetical protein|nr:DUF1501 domain-containing protein [Planctomycetaceae bacterium]